MNGLLAITPLLLAFVSTPPLALQEEQTLPGKVYINQCGTDWRLCEGARLVHAQAGYTVSYATYCHRPAGCGYGTTRVGWSYHYWRKHRP